MQGLPARSALRAREVYLVTAGELQDRLIALAGAGADKQRLANVASAQARQRLPPVKLAMLPDGRLFVEDGRHRLINAMRAGGYVVAQIGKTGKTSAQGTVPLVP